MTFSEIDHSYPKDRLMPSLLPLTESNHEIVYNVMARCREYFILQDGVPPTQEDARELFLDVPDNKSPADQFVLGYGQNGDIDGLIAVLRGYPQNRDWYIGLILVDPASRGRGIGQHLYRHSEEMAIEAGASRMLAAVIESNHLGQKFWKGLGFAEARLCPATSFKQMQHRRVELERSLVPRLSPYS